MMQKAKFCVMILKYFNISSDKNYEKQRIIFLKDRFVNFFEIKLLNYEKWETE